MLIDFFFSLKNAKIPVSVREYLTLLEAMKKNVIEPSIDQFYHLAKMSLVKDEQYFDKFDRAFGAYFQGVDKLIALNPDIPLNWLEQKLKHELSAEEKAAIEKLGGLNALMKRMAELLNEQKEKQR